MRRSPWIRPLATLLTASTLSLTAHAQPPSLTGDSLPEAGAEQGQAAQVTVRSGVPDVVVGLVKTRSFAVAGNVSAAGIGWDEQCTAPCTFKLKPGLRELVFRSPEMLATRELRIRPGENNIYIDPGNKGMRIGGNTLATLGVLGLLVGGSLLITRALIPETDSTGAPSSFREKTSWALPVTIGGAVAMAGGLTLSYVGRVRIDEVGQTQAEMTVSARGTF